MNIRELKKILEEKKLRFSSYWDEKRLIALTNGHDLLLKKSKDPKYDRIKTIKQNPRKVILEDIKKGGIKNLSIDLQSVKFYRSSPYDGILLGW